MCPSAFIWAKGTSEDSEENGASGIFRGKSGKRTDDKSIQKLWVIRISAQVVRGLVLTHDPTGYGYTTLTSFPKSTTLPKLKLSPCR